MKKLMKNKKGFTIVELVIVIAVIGILAAILIPTFTGVIDKANKNAAAQGARNKYTELFAKDCADGKVDGKEGTTNLGDSNYTVNNGKATYTYTTNGYTATFDGETLTVSEASGN